MKLESLMGRNEASGNIRKPAALGYSATAVTKVVASGIGPFSIFVKGKKAACVQFSCPSYLSCFG